MVEASGRRNGEWIGVQSVHCCELIARVIEICVYPIGIKTGYGIVADELPGKTGEAWLSKLAGAIVNGGTWIVVGCGRVGAAWED